MKVDERIQAQAVSVASALATSVTGTYGNESGDGDVKPSLRKLLRRVQPDSDG